VLHDGVPAPGAVAGDLSGQFQPIACLDLGEMGAQRQRYPWRRLLLVKRIALVAALTLRHQCRPVIWPRAISR
jgi:hypothetical protein